MNLALRAGRVTVLFAIGLVLLWFVLYGVVRPDQELAALLIWTPLLGIFTALWTFTLAGFLERGRRFTVALVLGAVGGLAWFVVATVPRGLWLAWLDLPIYVIWPLAAALGLAAVAPRPGKGARAEQTPWLSALYGVAGLAAFTLLLKVAPVSWLGPDPDLPWNALGAVAGERPSSAPTPAAKPLPELGAGGVPLTVACREPAPRPLPLDPVVVDSSSSARALGSFTDRRELETRGARHVYGRTLTLWSVEGALTGVLELRAGPVEDPENRGMLERARLEERTGTLTFDAYFGDGFVSRFRGALTRGSVDGVLVTLDAGCLSRIIATDTVTLRLEDGSVPPGESPTFRAVAVELAASGAFRRERSELDPVFRARSIAAEDGRWRSSTASATYFTGRFSGRREAAAALDPGQVVSTGGRSTALHEILYAVRIESSGRAEWVVIGPHEVLEAYQTSLYARAREGPPSDLRSRAIQVVPCC